MREKERINKETDDTDRWERETKAKSKRETEIKGLGFYQLSNSVSRLL